MIKVEEMTDTNMDQTTYKISAFADTKEEVVPGVHIVGLPEGATIEMGSSVITASGEIAFMKSDGNWNWV